MKWEVKDIFQIKQPITLTTHIRLNIELEEMKKLILLNFII